MRAFLKIFLALLIPISLIIAILLTLYFIVEYPFTQAMSLGVLYGLFAGVVITIIVSIILLFGGGTVNINQLLGKSKNGKARKNIIQTEVTHDKNHVTKSIDHKLMLLMNKELTFEVILTTLKDQFSQSLTTHNINKGSIHIKIYEENISIGVEPLTKHTSQVTINGSNNSIYIQDIVSFLKEKEHSFLQY